jgi:PAS domain S-box-containing protein
MKGPAGKERSGRLAELEARLVEAEDTLDAIRSGSIDALVVRTPRGEQLFTLRGADQTYRALVEAMNEGAITLNRNTIAYCNHHFAKMARAPLERVMGRPIFDFIRDEDFRRLIEGLRRGTRERGSLETVLQAAQGRPVPILISGCRFMSDNQAAIGLVVTDICERKEVERARHELSRRILNAQELERQRVARELHDGVNQLLSSAKYRLSNLWERDGERSAESVLQALELVHRAIAEVRLISRNLRPSELDDLGLAAALRSLTEEFGQRLQITAQFQAELDGGLPAEVEMALYRIAQEALNNVAHHSGATETKVILRGTGGKAWLTVQDNGVGLRARDGAKRNRGWGLKNMRERASLLGGVFTVSTAKGGGTVVTVSIPLPKLTDDDDNHPDAGAEPGTEIMSQTSSSPNRYRAARLAKGA